MTGAETRLPLSALQRPFWMHETLSPGTSRWTIVEQVTLRGPVRFEVLRAAVAAAGRRHAALRTRLHRAGTRPWQSFAHDDVPEITVSDLSDDSGAARWDDIVAAETGRCFALYDAPLARLHLARFGPAEARLLLSCHHIALDGEANAIVRRSIAASYGGAADDSATAAAEQAAYESWLRRDPRADPAFAEALKFWTAQADRALAPEALFDLPAGALPPTHAAHRADLPAPLLAALEARAGRSGSSVFALCLAAYARSLAAVTGVAAQRIGVVTARREAALAQVAGLFVNVLPLVLTVEADTAAQLAATDRQWRAARAFQHVPLATLAETSAGAVPLRLPVVFNFRGRSADRFVVPGLDTRLDLLSATQPPGDLLLFVRPAGEGFSLALRSGSPRVSDARLAAILAGTLAFLYDVAS